MHESFGKNYTCGCMNWCIVFLVILTSMVSLKHVILKSIGLEILQYHCQKRLQKNNGCIFLRNLVNLFQLSNVLEHLHFLRFFCFSVFHILITDYLWIEAIWWKCSHWNVEKSSLKNTKKTWFFKCSLPCIIHQFWFSAKNWSVKFLKHF